MRDAGRRERRGGEDIEAFIERDRRECALRKGLEHFRRKRRRGEGAALARVSGRPPIFVFDRDTSERDLGVLAGLLEDPANARSLHDALRRSSRRLADATYRDRVTVLRPTVLRLGARSFYGFEVRVSAWRDETAGCRETKRAGPWRPTSMPSTDAFAGCGRPIPAGAC